MDAYFRLAPERRRLFCEEAQAKLGLPASSIEKDFWVCWTLRELFGLHEWGSRLTFKGGTSLSKAWKLVDRFSEDTGRVALVRFPSIADKFRRACSRPPVAVQARYGYSLGSS